MRTLRIVVADDDPVIRMDLCAMLPELGHEVVGEADNGESACYLARNLKPDVVVLDIVMPKMDGLQAAAVITAERIAPVLMLTAYSDAQMIEAAVKAGVLAYLIKPFRKQELAPAVEVAVARYREMLALEGERTSLQDQLETRRILGRAKAILMERHGLAEREAYRRLQAQSLSLNKSLREIADAIVLTEDMEAIHK